jgi:hypothetical protein
LWLRGGSIAAIGAEGTLEARVIQLESGAEPQPAPLTRYTRLTTLAGGTTVAATGAAFYAAVIPVMGEAMRRQLGRAL